MSNVLVVAAHADDETLGAGATIAGHVARGDTVRVVFLTDGVGARKGLEGGKQAADARAAATVMAMQALGVTDWFTHDLPDNMLDSVPLLEIVKRVEQEIATFRPETVYTHYHGDLNIDHSLACRAVMTACRPVPGSCVKRILAFEIMSSTEWSFDAVFAPNHFVDITNFWAAKRRALECYGAEMRPSPHSRSFEHLEVLARHRGQSVGLPMAEAFMVLREIAFAGEGVAT